MLMRGQPMIDPAPIKHPEWLNLDATRHQALLDATTRMIRQTVVGQPVTPLPDDIAHLLVSGAFVSLKRKQHLRGCCGGLQSQPAALGSILPDAIMRTVYDDPRFPPVSPTELPFLDAELWLLFNPESVKTCGVERVHAVVTGGKHGLVARWGEQRGLLLPGVASERGWDAETFLEHVCLKAGLHPSRWQEDDTHLLTFEGLSIRGPVGDPGQESIPPFLSAEQLAGYVEFCRENLAAHLFGGTARYSPFDLPDGTISGLVLTLDPGTPERPLQASKIDFRRGLALHASLYQLTETLAARLIQSGASEADLQHLALAVFYDPTLHGSVSDADLRGVDPERRAVAILERGCSSVLYSAAGDVHASLREAADQLAVKDPDAATVLSLAADVSQPQVSLVMRPRPLRGPEVRPAAVAGAFYPGDPESLRTLVDGLLGARQPREAWAAALVPHAGLRYSGKVAAAVFNRLAIPSTVIILGPKHTPHGMDWAIAPNQQWSIPGAQFATDLALAQRLADAIPGLALDAAAHAQEHGIEVELPFLARLAPQARIVGVALGPASLAECQQFAAGLANVLGTLRDPPLLLISSDMNHFASDAATRRLDELALGCLDRLNPEALYDTCRRRHISMCGLVPAVIVLMTLRLLERLQRARRVAYATSADTTGDPGRVVGYAGMVFG
jgi:AmmeMemoRadiSam system protein B/AmmeMemoRadiSam system protein A